MIKNTLSYLWKIPLCTSAIFIGSLWAGCLAFPPIYLFPGRLIALLMMACYEQGLLGLSLPGSKKILHLFMVMFLTYPLDQAANSPLDQFPIPPIRRCDKGYLLISL